MAPSFLIRSALLVSLVLPVLSVAAQPLGTEDPPPQTPPAVETWAPAAPPWAVEVPAPNTQAHALWAFGAQLIYAELAANQDLPASQVAQALSLAAQAASQTGCMPASTVSAIGQLRNDVSRAPRSLPFYNAILALRLQLPPLITERCTCSGTGGGTPSTGGVQQATLQNGGAGTSFDAIRYRGKLFEHVAPGTISQICAYGQRAGTSVVVQVKPQPNAAPASFRATIPITAGQAWNCTSVSQPWSSSTLFIYKVDGDGAVGYESQQPTDSWYSQNQGASWAQDRWRRGYRIAFRR